MNTEEYAGAFVVFAFVKFRKLLYALRQRGRCAQAIYILVNFPNDPVPVGWTPLEVLGRLGAANRVIRNFRQRIQSTPQREPTAQ